MNKRFSLAAALACIAIVALIAFAVTPASAASYERVVFSNAKSGAVTNTAAFYNAQVLAVRAWNLAGSDITNAIVVNAITTDGTTNNLATFSITGAGVNQVTSSNLMLLRNDKVVMTASTNATVEILLDNRSR